MENIRSLDPVLALEPFTIIRFDSSECSETRGALPPNSHWIIQSREEGPIVQNEHTRCRRNSLIFDLPMQLEKNQLRVNTNEKYT